MLVIQGVRCRNPAIRTLVLTYSIVFFFACMTNHGILYHRHHDVMLGICFGLLVAATEIERFVSRRPMRAPAPKQNGNN